MLITAALFKHFISLVYGEFHNTAFNTTQKVAINYPACANISTTCQE
jgi:hypothetical protein